MPHWGGMAYPQQQGRIQRPGKRRPVRQEFPPVSPTLLELAIVIVILVLAWQIGIALAPRVLQTIRSLWGEVRESADEADQAPDPPEPPRQPRPPRS
ncbi:hypothetical protein F8S13_19115 [Chloroflexia bacterium SDU3-3]|nr:hypothetical protein F8S13_19115 [Chloroflexia bacterium SDU3-3]